MWCKWYFQRLQLYQMYQSWTFANGFWKNIRDSKPILEYPTTILNGDEAFVDSCISGLGKVCVSSPANRNCYQRGVFSSLLWSLLAVVLIHTLPSGDLTLLAYAYSFIIARQQYEE